jgi:predicted Zn-ribbon and HTH transcriptional regulator
MSMLWAFERLLADPDRVVEEAREHQAARARPDEDDAAPPPLRCKACGYEGAERYCPHCLADTMVPIRRAR